MKRTFTLLTLALLILGNLNTVLAQTWDWANQIAGSENIEVRDLTLDASGNILVYGYFTGNITIGVNSFTNFGASNTRDIYLAKYSSDGTLLWARQYGSDSNEDPFGIVTDESDNIFITGGFRNTASFDSKQIISLGGQDVFLAKISSSGTVDWARSVARGTSGNRGYDIDYQDGYLYITAMVKGTAELGSIGEPGGVVQITQTGGNYNSFAAKFDTSGDFYWATHFPCDDNTLLEAISVDEVGYLYVGGALIGTMTANGTDYTSTGSGDIIILQLNTSDGTVEWVRKGGGIGDDQLRSIKAIDNNIFVIGYVQGTGTIDSTATSQSSSYTAAGSDIFAARYNAEGRLLWKTIIGGPGWDSGYGIQIHENIMVCSGYFSSSVTFNESTITSGGGYDTVFFVFDLDGNPITAGSLSGDLEDRGQGVIYDGLGNTYISGYFASTELKYDDSGSLVSFTPPLSNSSSPSKDGFLAKYNNPFSAVFSHKKDVACNGGSTGELTVTTYFGTAPYTYAWTKDGSPYGSNTPILTNLPAGAYTVTVTDANLKTTQTSHTFTEPDAISDGGASLTHVTCPGGANGEISINPVGGTGNLSYFWTTSNGSGLVNDDQNQTGLMAGNYCLTITDENGCQFTKTYTLTDPDDIIITGSVTNITNPGNNGAVEITNISGGTGSYPADFSYNWVGPNSYSSTNKDVSGLNDEGDYTLTVTDNAGCTQDKTFNVVDEQVFSIWISSTTNVSCNGGNSGSATVSYFKPSGFPENPITYSWTLSSGGDVLSSMETASALLAGTYKVVVTYDDDDNPLTDNEHVIDNIQITQPTAITGSITPTVVSCHNGSDGSAVLTVSGGTPPNSYSWSSGHSSKDIMGQVAGDYSVTVTDNNGCEKLFETTITQPDDITVTIDETPVTCYGGSNGALSITGITGGNGGYSQLWSNTLTSSTISNLTAGYYSVTVTDSKGCQKFQAASVSEPTQISATFDITKPSCYGGADGELTVNASGGTSPYEYSIDGITFQVNSTFTNLIADTYTITIKDKADCTRSYNITVDQPSEISVNHTDNKPTCPESTDGSIGLTVSGGTGAKTYFWTGPGIVLPSVKDQTDLGVGSYSVRVTDENICYIDYPIILESANPTPTPTLDSDATSNTICSGNIITFTAGGGDEYVFYLNGSEIQARSTDNTFVASLLNDQDEVSVIVYSTAGCMAESLPITVTVNPLPEANISYAGSPYCATGTATPTQTGTTGGTYSSTAGLIIDATTGEVNLETSDAGTYTVTYAFSDGTCDNTTTAEIVVNPLPEATISYAGSPYCATGTATPTQTGTTGGTYSSTAGLVIDATTGEVNLETSDAGTYTVTYAFSDGTCDNTTTAEIVVNPLPEVTLATLADVCVDATPFTLTGGLPVGGSYSGNGVMGSSFDPNAAGVGTHTITYTYTDGNGCVNFATQDITVNPLPEATISYAGSPYCATGTATPTQTGTTGGTYSSTAGLVIDATTGEVNLETSDAGTYTVTYAFSDGTCDNTTTAEIAVNPLPTVTAPADFETCSGETITLTASGDATSYTWDNSVVDGVPFVITETTTFTVTGTNTTTGCSATNEVMVTVNPIPEPLISTEDKVEYYLDEDISTVFTVDINDAESYQWFNNGIAIPSADQPNYTATEVGVYSAEVTVNGCSGISNEIEITQISKIGYIDGDNIVCSGNGPVLELIDYSYITIISWEYSISGTIWQSSGDNNPVFYAPPINQTTQYRVKAKNSLGLFIYTDLFTVDVDENTIGGSVTGSTSICQGETSELTLTGHLGDVIKWQLSIDNGTAWIDIENTATTYTSDALTLTTLFRAVVKNGACDEAFSDAATITVYPTPEPTISTINNLNICSGDDINVAFTCDIYNADTYQWFKNGGVINGAVESSYTATELGVYSLKVTVNGCLGSSNELTIVEIERPAPTISTQDNVDYNFGETINTTFIADIINNVPVESYQWFNNGTAIPDANQSTYTATEVGVYSAEVMGINGCTGTSNPIEITQNQDFNPIITTDDNLEWCEGQDILVNLSVNIANADEYVWFRNDGVIPEASTQNIIVEEDGVYKVKVTVNEFTATSNEIEIVTLPTPKPTISTEDNLTWTEDETISVTFTVDITDADAYQWLNGDEPITDAISTSYEATEVGEYSVLVTKGICTGQSNTLTVTIETIPLYDVTFTVQNTSGDLIENAEIFVDTFDPIVTNEAGVAILSCPEGTYSYQVRLEEYNTSEGEFTVIDQNIDVSVVMVPSGISDEEFLSIKLYPNPFNNEIKISDPELITRAIITSISGQKIMDINLEGTDTINTQKLTPGVYLIRLYTQNSESKIYKMVKNR
ncbi:MAG: T9SS type A sorting domain-containing protein [Bacteroidales bacterium]|nr:T9SS type A sorting domain-containing protein [Bacteroidales bacterium]